MGDKYAVFFDFGMGNVTASQLKQTLADLRKTHTLYDYDDYTADEMHALFKSKLSTFYNRQLFHDNYGYIVRQLRVTAPLKPFDSFFYLDAIDNKPKVGVAIYKRNKSGYAVNIYEKQMTDYTFTADELKNQLASMMKRLVLYRYGDYTPAKMYDKFKLSVPAKYDLAWFEEQYERINKFKNQPTTFK